MIRLVVEGEELDLFKDEVFAISKAVSKIGDLNLRNGDVSINFKVPATAKNNEIFRYLYNLNNNNLGAFKRFEGVVLDGQSVVSVGYYQVLKTNPLKKVIELRFYGGNSDWFDLIKDRSINKTYINETNNPNAKSYDLSYMNHTFVEENIKLSWGNNEGYKYFPIDNGSNSEKLDNSFTKEDFQLGVFQHTIVDNILNSVGIKLAGNLLNDPLYYNNLVNLPSDLSLFAESNNQKRYTTNGGNIVDNSTYKNIIFNQNDFDTQWDGNTFTSLGDADSVIFRLSYNGKRGLLTSDEIDLRINYTLNSIPQTDINTTLLPVGTESRGGVVYVLMDYYEVTFNNVKAGDTFNFKTKVNNGGVDVWETQNEVSINGTSYQSSLQYEVVNGVVPYSITDAIPEINQAKFMQDVMFRFGCISQFDSINRTLYIDKFDTIERNKTKGLDFTKKVDLSKDINIDFTKLLQKYFKTTYIKYVEDDKDLTSILNKRIFQLGLGDGEINIDNDNLSDEGTIYESPFASTTQYWSFPFSGGFDTSNFYIPSMSLFNGSGDVNELKPRLLVNAGNIPIEQINKNGYTNITFNGNNESTVGYAFFTKEILEDVGVTDKGLNSNLDTLSFQHYEGNGSAYIGNTLLEKYYNLQSKILNAPIFLSIYLKLDDLDIEKIDFLTPIWIETQVDSGYYYINEISQYKGDGSTTKVNLVKI